MTARSSITGHHTESGVKSNRTRYGAAPTILGMGEKQRTIRDVLWANTLALMNKHYGRENLNRLARDTGIGPGGASRLKEAKTNVGLGVLEKLGRFFQVPPHRLLAPDLGGGPSESDLPAKEQMILALYRGLTPEQQRELVLETMASVEANRRIKEFVKGELHTFSNEEVRAAFGDIPPLRRRRQEKAKPKRDPGTAMDDFLEE